MPRILIISSIFPPEPVVSANLSRDVAVALSKTNDVVVVCPKPSRPFGFEFVESSEQKNYKVVRLNSYICPASKLFGRFRESYSFGKYCVKYIRKNFKKIDLIYVNSWPLISQYLIIKAGRKYNIPTVIHVQDIYPESLISKLPVGLRNMFYYFLLPFDKFILRNATKILCISETMISYLSLTRKINKNNFELVRNWQDDQRFLDDVPQLDKTTPFVFMYVGSISASADVALLIKSFHNANLPNSKLFIAGDGSEKQSCLEIASNLKNTKIEFQDIIPENVPAIQSKADVLLLPLRKGISTTATPSKLTAYLFSGKPVIACVETKSDVAFILKENNCGFVVYPENIELLSGKMKEVYKIEKAKLRQMGNNGKEYAKKNLSRAINLAKIENLIGALVRN